MNKNWFSFNDFNTRNYALIEELPVVDRAEEDKEFVEIEGRHGFLTFDKKTYKPIEYTVTMIIKGKERRDVVKRALKGSGNLILSNEVSRYYKAVVSSSMTFERQIRDVFKVVVSFKLQPFAYERNNEPLTYNSPFTLSNLTNATLQPIFRISGSGTCTLSINNNDIKINEIGGCIILNFELKEAYGIDGQQKNAQILGELEDLIEGDNIITWNGGISSIHVTPNWRWV